MGCKKCKGEEERSWKKAIDWSSASRASQGGHGVCTSNKGQGTKGRRGKKKINLNLSFEKTRIV